MPRERAATTNNLIQVYQSKFHSSFLRHCTHNREQKDCPEGDVGWGSKHSYLSIGKENGTPGRMMRRVGHACVVLLLAESAGGGSSLPWHDSDDELVLST